VDKFEHDLHEVFGERAAEFSAELRGHLKQLWELGSASAPTIMTVSMDPGVANAVVAVRVASELKGQHFDVTKDFKGEYLITPAAEVLPSPIHDEQQKYNPPSPYGRGTRVPGGCESCGGSGIGDYPYGCHDCGSTGVSRGNRDDGYRR
jgi:hypothetical protein